MSQIPDTLVAELVKMGEDIGAVLDDVVAVSKANDTFTDQTAKSLTFFGKSLEVWDDELALPLEHREYTPEDIRWLWVELGNKMQIASHYYTQSMAANTISTNSIDIKRSELVTALVAHYHGNQEKPPPATVLEKLVDSYLRKLSSIANASKIIRDFWREKLNRLDKLKSIIESIAIASAVEMKYLAQDD